MRVYRFAANVQPKQGLTADDALAVVTSAVDALTIVDRTEADHPVPGLWCVTLDYIGQNPNEAAETARRAMAALARAGYAADAPSLVDMTAPHGRNRVPL